MPSVEKQILRSTIAYVARRSAIANVARDASKTIVWFKSAVIDRICSSAVSDRKCSMRCIENYRLVVVCSSRTMDSKTRVRADDRISSHAAGRSMIASVMYL